MSNKEIERIETLRKQTNLIIELVKMRAEKSEAQNVPDFYSYEIIDLVENVVKDHEDQRPVAKKILDEMDCLDLAAKKEIRKYFEIYN